MEGWDWAGNVMGRDGAKEERRWGKGREHSTTIFVQGRPSYATDSNMIKTDQSAGSFDLGTA